jgi:hypothetical protein
MSRNFVLALGALLWAGVAVDGFAHIVGGDLITPAVVGIGGTIWAAVRWPRQKLAEAA